MSEVLLLQFILLPYQLSVETSKCAICFLNKIPYKWHCLFVMVLTDFMDMSNLITALSPMTLNFFPVNLHETSTVL